MREIDDWFHQKSHKRHLAYLVRTYTAHTSGNVSAAGFYSLTLGSELWNELAVPDRRSSDSKSFPAVQVHYFAVHRSMQRRGIGRLLMAHALEQSCEIARIAGAHAVKLIAANEEVAEFYLKLGFRTYSENDGRPMMLLPIQSLIEA